MKSTDDTQTPLFKKGGARWLREKGINHLSTSEQALLLAMTKLETEMGRELTEEESETIEILASNMDGFDPEAIASAVHQLVSSPADPRRRMTWPEIKHQK